MTSHAVGSRPWHAWAVVLLAIIPAVLLVLFVLLASDMRSASADTPPDPIARAWGINSFGQLGDDSSAPRSKQVPVKSEDALSVLGNATSLDGGQNHSVAFKNGTVYTWGHNGLGQLGYDPDPATSAREDSDRPGQVDDLTNVLAVAAGGNFSLALVSDGTGDNVANDGTVWAWGDNFQGQLGHGIPASSNVPVQVKDPGDLLDPNDDIVLEDVVAVAAGSGQLGDSTSHAGNQSRIPVQVQGVGGSGFLTGVSDVAACTAWL